MYDQNNEVTNTLKMLQRGLSKIVNAGLFELQRQSVKSTLSEGGVTHQFLSQASLSVPKAENITPTTLCVIVAGSRGGACSLSDVKNHAPLLLQLLQIEV